jgi:hypothetical protein
MRLDCRRRQHTVRALPLSCRLELLRQGGIPVAGFLLGPRVVAIGINGRSKCAKTFRKADTESRCTTVPPAAYFPQ